MKIELWCKSGRNLEEKRYIDAVKVREFDLPPFCPKFVTPFDGFAAEEVIESVFDADSQTLKWYIGPDYTGELREEMERRQSP